MASLFNDYWSRGTLDFHTLLVSNLTWRETFWWASNTALWLLLLFMGFLLLGTLRSLGLLSWRLQQLEATTPKRLGRDGLKCGAKAPDFTLKNLDGANVSLHDFAGRKVLLTFTQNGCSPCHEIAPELNHLQRKGDPQVLVINNGDAEEARDWANKSGARFPVLAQGEWTISKRYQVFATPFAFLINERGVIASKGIINNRQHIGYLLSGAHDGTHGEQNENGTDSNQSEVEPAGVQVG